MDLVFPDIPAFALWVSVAVALIAGLVKGVVGFAMPMILISGVSSVVEPRLALAGLILPTLISNGMQALRQGPRAALSSVRRFRGFLAIGFVMLVLSSQLVTVLPIQVLLLVLGVLIVGFALLQLAGVRFSLPDGPTLRAELSVGAFAGFVGGLSGVWGPPTVAYLTAINTEKREQIRVQGVIYGLGSVALTGAHVVSGIFTAQTALFSALLVGPAVLGMVLGTRVQDRIDQSLFRKVTLAVLLVAGLNLVRRAVF